MSLEMLFVFQMSPEMCAASNCKLIELKRNINRRDMKGMNYTVIVLEMS
jgi:hypothetical protein